MIYDVEIIAYFPELQNGVNTRIANINIYITDTATNKLYKYFPISPEIIRETETEDSYEIDFRRCYVGREEGRILSKLGIIHFRKISENFKELKIEI